MYIGAALYQIHATVLNCTAFNLLKDLELYSKAWNEEPSESLSLKQRK